MKEYHNFIVSELREECIKRGIQLGSRYIKKNELIKLLENSKSKKKSTEKCLVIGLPKSVDICLNKSKIESKIESKLELEFTGSNEDTIEYQCKLLYS